MSALERVKFKDLRPGDLFFYPTRVGLPGPDDVDAVEEVHVRTNGAPDGWDQEPERTVVRISP